MSWQTIQTTKPWHLINGCCYISQVVLNVDPSKHGCLVIQLLQPFFMASERWWKIEENERKENLLWCWEERKAESNWVWINVTGSGDSSTLAMTIMNGFVYLYRNKISKIITIKKDIDNKWKYTLRFRDFVYFFLLHHVLFDVIKRSNIIFFFFQLAWN